MSSSLRPLCLREEIPIRKLGGLRIGSGCFIKEQRLSYPAANRTPGSSNPVAWKRYLLHSNGVMQCEVKVLNNI
jgi:hypothetical protein